MSRKMPPLEELVGHAEPDRASLDRVWVGVKRRERQLALRPWLATGSLLAVGAVAIALVLWAPFKATARESLSAALAQATPPTTLTAADGSTLTLERGTQVHAEPSASGVVLHLDRGVLRLAVRAGVAPWVVETARLKVMVMADSALQLEVADSADSVSVSRGQATVAGPQVVTPLTLSAGQRFATGSRGWLELARAGNFEGAWQLLGREGVRRELDAAAPSDALMLADIAGTGHDDTLAVEVLEAVSRSAPSPQRELAWFSLGVRLSAAGETRRAAEAFEASYTEALPKGLRRDACQRAADAWKALGDDRQATRWRERAAQE